MNAYNKFLLLSLATSLSLLLASPAKAEMSQGAADTLKACAYMGAIGGAGAHVIQEKGAVKMALGSCAVAAAAVGGYNYLAIPTNEAPTEKEIQQVEPVPSDQLE